MNPRGRDCSELRSCHCTPAWRQSETPSKKKNQVEAICRRSAFGLQLQPFPGTPGCQPALQTLDLHLHSHVSQFLKISLFMYTHTRAHTCTHAHTHAHTRAHTHARTHTHTQSCPSILRLVSTTARVDYCSIFSVYTKQLQIKSDGRGLEKMT